MPFWKYCLSIVLIFFITDVYAHETAGTSSALSLEFGRDSADSEEAYLDLDTGLKNGMHIKWMSGGTRLNTDSDEYETRSRSIGISSDYGAPFVAGFDYDYWGNPQTIETQTRRFKLGVNTDDWYVQLVYEDRNSRLRTKGFLKLKGIVIDLPDVSDIGSIGRGVDISYYGFFPFSINVSYIEYAYDKNINGFAKYPGLAQALFPPSTLGMTTGFEAWRRFGDISYNLDWGAFGLNGSQSESAMDESLASSGSVYLIWEITHDWSTTFTVGKSVTDTSDETISFARLAVTHRW